MNLTQKIILITSLISTFLFIEYHFFMLVTHRSFADVQRCGTVVDKLQPSTMDIHKHSANIRVEEFMYVNYDGKIIKEQVSADTYYKFSKGDSICFTSTKAIRNEFLSIGVGGFLGFILNITLITALLMFLWSLAGGSTFIEALESIWD